MGGRLFTTSAVFPFAPSTLGRFGAAPGMIGLTSASEGGARGRFVGAVAGGVGREVDVTGPDGEETVARGGGSGVDFGADLTAESFDVDALALALFDPEVTGAILFALVVSFNDPSCAYLCVKTARSNPLQTTEKSIRKRALRKRKDELDPFKYRLHEPGVDVDRSMMLLVHRDSEEFQRFQQISIVQQSVLVQFRNDQRQEDEFDWRERFRRHPHWMWVRDSLSIDLSTFRPSLSIRILRRAKVRE